MVLELMLTRPCHLRDPPPLGTTPVDERTLMPLVARSIVPQDFELALVSVHGGDGSMTAQTMGRLIATPSW